jgi:hypothetical protein
MNSSECKVIDWKTITTSKNRAKNDKNWKNGVKYCKIKKNMSETPKLTLVSCEIWELCYRMMLERYLLFKNTLTCAIHTEIKNTMISAGLWENLKTVKSCQKKHTLFAIMQNWKQNVMNSSEYKEMDWKTVKTSMNLAKKDNNWKNDVKFCEMMK